MIDECVGRIAEITTALTDHARPADGEGVSAFDLRHGLETTLAAFRSCAARQRRYRPPFQQRSAGPGQAAAGQSGAAQPARQRDAGDAERWPYLSFAQRDDPRHHPALRRRRRARRAPENRERIFDPFFTTRPPGEGTGLGLYLSRQIIEAHGGTLRVGTSESGGAEFAIELPLPSAQDAQVVPSAMSGPVGRRQGAGQERSHEHQPAPTRTERLPSSPSLEIPPSVLYVDDDRANLLAFRAIAEPQYVVVTARSAEEALRILEQRRDFAVLLSDQRMPGLSGIDLCERVHASHPDIERMLVTAYSDLGAAIAAINRGHVGRYLHKPWNTDELLATLRDAVERHRLRVMVQRLQVRISETERMYALGVLTASIGHELRTPLSVVTSSVEYCRKALQQSVAQLGSALPAASPALANLREIDGALSDAADGAQRLLEVVDGINLSARGEAPVRVPVDVSHVVQSVLRLVRGEAAQRASWPLSCKRGRLWLVPRRGFGQVLLNWC